MRTPKGPKAGGRGAAGAKSQVNKLRKKAMKTKMMKKTMLALDDTKDDYRGLMNDSNVSSISIIGSPAQKQQRQQKPKSPARKKVAKSESSLSLKNLSSQLSRRTSRRKLRDEPVLETYANMEVMETDGDEALAKQGNTIKVVKVQNGGEHHDAGSGGAAANGVHEENDHTEEGASRFQGVKNLLSSAVWGVPYAKVVDDGQEVEANSSKLSTKSESASGCTIS